MRINLSSVLTVALLVAITQYSKVSAEDTRQCIYSAFITTNIFTQKTLKPTVTACLRS